MPLVKLLLQSVVSNSENFLTLDIEDFYLNTPLDRPEFLRISSRFLPPHIVDKNNLQPYLKMTPYCLRSTKACMAFLKPCYRHKIVSYNTLQHMDTTKQKPRASSDTTPTAPRTGKASSRTNLRDAASYGTGSG